MKPTLRCAALSLLGILFLGSCSPGVLRAYGPVQFAWQGNTVILEGNMDVGDEGERFLTFVGQRVPERLIVNSPGGQVESGMVIGTYVFKNQIPVQVSGTCGSSCANYILAASPSVTADAGSTILFHGGVVSSRANGTAYVASEKVAAADKERATAALQRLETMENDFFKLVYVDPSFMAIGGSFVTDNEIDFWAPTVNEMNCYGFHVSRYEISKQKTSVSLTSQAAKFPPVLKCKT